MRTAATAARIFLAIGLAAAISLPPSSRAADVASLPQRTRLTTQEAGADVALASGERVRPRLDFECADGRLGIAFVLPATRTPPAPRPSAVRGRVVAYDAMPGRRVERRSWRVSWAPDGRPWTWAVPVSSKWLRRAADVNRLVFHPDPPAPVRDSIEFVPYDVDQESRFCADRHPRPTPPPSPGKEYVYVEEFPELLERVACAAPAGGPSTGTVVVQVLIGKDGRVRDCKIARSSPGLDTTALACAREYRFQPSKSNGKPVAVWHPVPIRFGAPEETPEAISKVPPTYPQPARDERIEGMVVVQALVDATGRVARCRVKVSIPGLDEAAIESVSQWRFRPAALSGRPIATWLDIPIRFTLR